MVARRRILLLVALLSAACDLAQAPAQGDGDERARRGKTIASYTYLLVPEELKEREKGLWLARFLWWAVHDGQKFSNELDYARLPDKVVARIEDKLKALRSGGMQLLQGV